MSQLHISLEDHSIIFQFGIFNSEYPNIITQREFILDYDCASKDESEPEGVLSTFRLYYEDIKKVFKQCRGEKLLRIMKEETML